MVGTPPCSVVWAVFSAVPTSGMWTGPATFGFIWEDPLHYTTVILTLWFCLGNLSVVVAETPQTDLDANVVDGTYQETLAKWQFENEKKLAAPEGWLALIAHVWLEPGTQSLGTDAKDTIRLPRELGDAVRGRLLVNGNRVRLESGEESRILVNGQWKPSHEIHVDDSKLEADSPDKISIDDRITMQLVRRNGSLAVRVRDARSDAISRFSGKRWYPIDPKYCVQARYHAFDEAKPIRIVNIRGQETTVSLVGYSEFELDGRKLRLDAMLESPSELFFVFKDLTCGKTSYGPGRFLNTEVPQDGETFVMDFNKTYNPPCAFSPHTLCPLPSKENHLPVEIPAGEMMPRAR